MEGRSYHIITEVSGFLKCACQPNGTTYTVITYLNCIPLCAKHILRHFLWLLFMAHLTIHAHVPEARLFALPVFRNFGFRVLWAVELQFA